MPDHPESSPTSKITKKSFLSVSSLPRGVGAACPQLTVLVVLGTFSFMPPVVLNEVCAIRFYVLVRLLFSFQGTG